MSKNKKEKSNINKVKLLDERYSSDNDTVLTNPITGEKEVTFLAKISFSKAWQRTKDFFKKHPITTIMVGAVVAIAGIALAATVIGAAIAVPLIAGGVVAVGVGIAAKQDLKHNHKDLYSAPKDSSIDFEKFSDIRLKATQNLNELRKELQKKTKSQAQRKVADYIQRVEYTGFNINNDSEVNLIQSRLLEVTAEDKNYKKAQRALGKINEKYAQKFEPEKNQEKVLDYYSKALANYKNAGANLANSDKIRVEIAIKKLSSSVRTNKVTENIEKPGQMQNYLITSNKRLTTRFDKEKSEIKSGKVEQKFKRSSIQPSINKTNKEQKKQRRKSAPVKK